MAMTIKRMSKLWEHRTIDFEFPGLTKEEDKEVKDNWKAHPFYRNMSWRDSFLDLWKHKLSQRSGRD